MLLVEQLIYPRLEFVEASAHFGELLAQALVLLLRVRRLHVLAGGAIAHLLDLKPEVENVVRNDT